MRVAALLASAALIAAPAYAQNTDYQLELRGSYSGTTITVGQAEEIGGTAVAGGNALSRSGEDVDVSLTSVQHMDGDANSQAEANVGSAAVVVINSAAVGNGATATSVNADIDADITQFEHGNANAETRLNAGNVWTAASSSSSAANVAAVSAENGDIRSNITQESTGSINAGVEANHDNLWGQVVSGAVASANNVAIAGSTTTLLSNTNQAAHGDFVTASVDLYATTAGDAVGNATANANAVTIDNAWGYLNATARQAATTEVRADSYVTLGQDFEGFATASAYGVGNSMMAANLASDTVLNVEQENEGAVDANAALSGGGGDQALASSAAYGNVVTGSLCAYCDSSSPGLQANSSQYNDGAVTSTATVNSSRARQVAASSSAIGNAATYQVTGPTN